MKISLSEEGVFPIVNDIHGNKIEVNTNLDISGTVQGEGKLIGTSCLFIRLSLCNLRCLFKTNGFIEPCDTPHTSWFTKQERLEIDEVIQLVKSNIGNLKYLVITGGEPLLQKKQLIELTSKLKQLFPYLHITIETNGTMFDNELCNYVDLFSISPKLSNSNVTKEKVEKINKINNTSDFYSFPSHNTTRYNLEVLQKYVDYKNLNSDTDIQFKFVVSNEKDINEINEMYVSKLLDVDTKDILLMPVGMTTEHLLESQKLVLSQCIKNGWRYTNRLHIELFGNKKGV